MEAVTKTKVQMTRSERSCRVLLIVMVVCASLWGLWQILIPKPSVSADPVVSPAAEPSPARADGKPERADAAVRPQPDSGDEPDTIGVYDRKEDFYTFLFVGMDKSGGNTDSLMLVSYDVANQSVSIASIARDTRVDVDRKLKKINAAYALNNKMDGLKDEVSMTFGVPIDKYLRVNIRGFVRLVNAVDGIDFSVPCYMSYDDPYQDLSIHYSKGMQHLNGQQALEVCRFRQNNDGSGYGDEGRQKTQRAVLTAVLKKVLAHPEKISEYISIAQDNLDTDLSLADMTWFAGKIISFNMENLNAMSMPCEWHNPYMYLDPDATLEIVNTYFNPYVLDRTAEMLDIVSR